MVWITGEAIDWEEPGSQTQRLAPCQVTLGLAEEKPLGKERPNKAASGDVPRQNFHPEKGTFGSMTAIHWVASRFSLIQCNIRQTGKNLVISLAYLRVDVLRYLLIRELQVIGLLCQVCTINML